MILTHINTFYYILTKHIPISTSHNLFCKMPAASFTMPLDIKGNETEGNLKREKAVVIVKYIISANIAKPYDHIARCPSVIKRLTSFLMFDY